MEPVNRIKLNNQRESYGQSYGYNNLYYCGDIRNMYVVCNRNSHRKSNANNYCCVGNNLSRRVNNIKCKRRVNLYMGAFGFFKFFNRNNSHCNARINYCLYNNGNSGHNLHGHNNRYCNSGSRHYTNRAERNNL